MPDKKWLKRKGCKNCALVWNTLPHYEDCDTDCKGHGEWLVQPYYPDREFEFISKRIDFTQEQVSVKNVYLNEEGNLVSINGGRSSLE